MKKLLVVWMCVALAAPAGWARPHSAVGSENAPTAGSASARSAAIADVLICTDIDNSPGIFHDLTQLYVDAFTAAGVATIATAATEVSGGSINFPPNLTAENYPVVVVLGCDNYFSGSNNIDATDEAALAAYLDTGGSLLLVGQDYMGGAHPDMNAPNPCYGFPRDYLGLDVCYQDFDTPGPNLNIGHADPRSTEATITGVMSWIFVGVIILLVALIAFPNTGYLMSDRATTTRTGGMGFDYAGQFSSGEGVLTYNDTRGFRTVWSGIELAAAETEDFNSIIETLYGWLTYETPVERTSWTAVKAQYR